MPQYYKLDSRKCSFAEYWRLSPNPFLFLIVAIFKILRVPINLGGGFPDVRRFDSVRTEDLPEESRESVGVMIRDCRQLGFEPATLYTLPFLGKQIGFGAGLLDPAGTTVASLIFSENDTNGVVTTQSVIGMVSLLADGTLLATSNMKKLLNKPPHVDSLSLPDASARDLYQRHLERLRTGEHPPRKLQLDEVEAEILKYNQDEASYYVRRGLYKKMTNEEVAVLKSVGDRWRKSKGLRPISTPNNRP